MTTRSISTFPSGTFGEPARLAAAVVLAGAAGATLVVEPMLAFAPLAILASALLLVDGRARIVFVVLGGLFVFQRGDELNAPKMAFLLLFSVAFAGAFFRILSLRASYAFRAARPLFAVSVAFVVLAAVSLAVANHYATPLFGAWLRDIAPYLLFASAPVFALDAHAAMSRAGLVKLLVVAGSLGAIAFSIHWLNRRGIADLQASSIGLASHFVAAALFVYGISAALHERRTRWLALAAGILALLLVTGNRATLVLLAAPLAIALASRRRRTARSIRLAFLGPLAIVATLVLAVGVVRATGADEASLAKRVDILRSTGSSSDASYVERLAQADVAVDVFDDHPVLGRGPGTIFRWQAFDRSIVESFVLDTPLTYPAKFGLFGLLVLAFAVWKYGTFVRSLLRFPGATVASLALVGYLVIIAGTALGVSPLEDKGLSFGLMLLLALSLADASEAERPAVTQRISAGVELPPRGAAGGRAV